MSCSTKDFVLMYEHVRTIQRNFISLFTNGLWHDVDFLNKAVRHMRRRTILGYSRVIISSISETWICPHFVNTLSSNHRNSRAGMRNLSCDRCPN